MCGILDCFATGARNVVVEACKNARKRLSSQPRMGGYSGACQPLVLAPSLPSRFLISASASENGWLTSLQIHVTTLKDTERSFESRCVEQSRFSLKKENGVHQPVRTSVRAVAVTTYANSVNAPKGQRSRSDYRRGIGPGGPSADETTDTGRDRERNSIVTTGLRGRTSNKFYPQALYVGSASAGRTGA